MTISVFTEDYKRFRKMMAQARKDANLSQIALSKKLGKPDNFVNRYESGERRLDIVEVSDILKVLNVDYVKFIKKLFNL